MQEYTITRIARQEKVSKAGKPYTSVGLQVAEFGQEWINGFGNKDNANWKEGDKVKMIIKDEVYNGKTSKKFETPKKEDALWEAIKDLQDIQKLHGTYIKELVKKIKELEGGKSEYAGEEINPDDISF